MASRARSRRRFKSSTSRLTLQRYDIGGHVLSRPPSTTSLPAECLWPRSPGFSGVRLLGRYRQHRRQIDMQTVSVLSRLLYGDWGSGFSTIALPPPRRTGSAAARTRPPDRNSIPVAAPISGVELKL